MKFLKYYKLDLSCFNKITNYQVLRIFKSMIYIKNNNKIGVIDKYGNIVLDVIYDDITYFKNNYAVILINKKMGLIDSNFNIVIPPIYDYLDTDSDLYIVARKDNKKGIIDYNNNQIVPFIYYNIKICGDNFIAKKGNIYDILDCNNNIIRSIKAYGVNKLSNGLFEIEYRNRRYKPYERNMFLYSLLDIDRKINIHKKFEYIRYFSDNCIIVDKKYIIDRMGRKKYKLNKFLIINDSKVIEIYNDEYVTTSLIKFDGSLVTFNYKDISKFKDGVAVVHNLGERFLIDVNGNRLTSNSDEIIVKNDRYYVNKNGATGYFDRGYNFVKCDNNLDSKNIHLIENDDLVVSNIDGKTYFVYKNGNKIDTNDKYYSGTLNNNYIILEKYDSNNCYNILYKLDGTVIIPLIKEKIFVVDDNTVMIDGYIIDLTLEYINIKGYYCVDFYDKNKKYQKQFENEYDLYQFIKSISDCENLRDMKIKYLKDELKRLKHISIIDFSKEVKNESGTYEKKK